MRQEYDAAEQQKRPDGWDDGLFFYVQPHDPDGNHHQKQQQWKGAR